MSSEGSIPPSIRDALDSKSGYVIVVTGKPGTGKTLFVQEVFREFQDSFLILSNAESMSVSDKELSSQQNWPDRHVLAHYWRTHNEGPMHVDPLHEQLRKLLGGSPISESHNVVIIDSWTDFLMPVKVDDRYEIQQSLIFAARNEGKKLVLVTEGDWDQEQQKPLHHSADAIIRLRKLREDQRMYRQMTIEKMRFMPLTQDTFLFTLNNGRFTYVPWHVHQFPPITIEREPTKDPASGRISTGNRSLDGIIGGGFQKGALSLIEVENLAAPYLETIYIPFLSNHLQLGRPAVILLPEGWSPEQFTQGLCHFVDATLVEEQVVFFGRHAVDYLDNVRAIDDDPWKTLQEIRYEANQLERKFDTEATELFSLDTLENKYGVTDVKGMIAEITASLPAANRATISILGEQQGLKSGSIAYSIHLRVQELNGVLSVCGVNPRTNYLAVKPLLSKGFLDYELVPIV
ncbi:MAG: AAA family ATPase [Candidatus Thorarchaeota archaeon]|nr:AAA family ATPase [Candidatus Thorarchaeota archaeon]